MGMLIAILITGQTWTGWLFWIILTRKDINTGNINFSKLESLKGTDGGLGDLFASQDWKRMNNNNKKKHLELQLSLVILNSGEGK